MYSPKITVLTDDIYQCRATYRMLIKYEVYSLGIRNLVKKIYIKDELNYSIIICHIRGEMKVRHVFML